MQQPDNEAALAECVREAASAKTALKIQGGGSRAGFGHAVSGTTLSTTGLSGISLYDPGALTMVAGAGTPLDEIESALAAEGQLLPFEPPRWTELLGNTTAQPSTIGGVVATNASGPRRIQAGACRDSLIGVRFVDGCGRVLKNGGRVMKNVTGYDLVKLMCGTHGTLGVITEVAFKLLPAPVTTNTISLAGLDDKTAVSAMSAALGSPYNVSAAIHVPATEGSEASTYLRLEGLERSVDYRARELVKVLQPFGTATIDDDPASAIRLWQTMRDVAPMAVADDRDLWRVSVRPSAGPDVAQALAGAACVYDWGGGLVWASVDAGTDVRAQLPVSVGGHASLFRAQAQTQDAVGVFEREAAPLARISDGLKAQFDPAGILNPGRMRQHSTVAAA